MLVLRKEKRKYKEVYWFFESDPHVCRVRRPVPGKVESGVPVRVPPLAPIRFSRQTGGRSEPAPVNRLVISSAVSNMGSFGIPKTSLLLRLVLQLGGALGELADHIRTSTTMSVPPLG
ncbi:hypothetical protein TNCV_1645521 [Trichonephila clavipes]|nr:hypothetical protein TNCV_1645521 [Trichonephila clavipes]